MLALDGYPLEVTLTAANSAAQAWYGYDQVRVLIQALDLSDMSRESLLGF